MPSSALRWFLVSCPFPSFLRRRRFFTPCSACTPCRCFREARALVGKRRSGMSVRSTVCGACNQPIMRNKGTGGTEDVVSFMPKCLSTSLAAHSHSLFLLLYLFSWMCFCLVVCNRRLWPIPVSLTMLLVSGAACSWTLAGAAQLRYAVFPPLPAAITSPNVPWCGVPCMLLGGVVALLMSQGLPKLNTGE